MDVFLSFRNVVNYVPLDKDHIQEDFFSKTAEHQMSPSVTTNFKIESLKKSLLVKVKVLPITGH
jgi:hypothetical protein